MQTNHVYYIEFYVLVGATLDGDNSVGLRFFKDRPIICENQNRPGWPTGVAHLTVPTTVPTLQWTRYSFIYKPTENWEWICLGDFADNKNDQTKSYWDDIKILDLGEGQCPYQWVWENTTFDDVHTVYQASNLIYAGYDFDNAGVYGPVVIKANSDVIFRSGDVIWLDTGFVVEPGAYFETEIAPCQENPCPTYPDLANQYFLCDSLPVHIGTSSSPMGVFYSWSPSTYLDNDTSSNPLFTPPPDSVGRIEYDVTITSVCAGFTLGDELISWETIPFFVPSVTEHITVGFDSDPDPNPSIGLSNISTGNYNFSFDAQVSEHTEKVCVSFLESGTGYTYGPMCLYRFDDFDSTFFTFTYDNLPALLLDQLTVCRDYQVIVTAKNFCFDTTAADTFFWDRSSTLQFVSVPNILTLRDPATGYSNGLNDEFCIEVDGADNYMITVSSTSNIVHQSIGDVLSGYTCIWDGKCNYFPHCSSPDLATGSYAVMIEITNECPDDEQYNDYVVIAYDEPPGMATLPDQLTPGQQDAQTLNHTTASINGEPSPGAVKVYPNPANHKIYVQLPAGGENTRISLRNGIGQLMGTYTAAKTLCEVDVAHLQAGLYFIRVEQAGGPQEFKVIISR